MFLEGLDMLEVRPPKRQREPKFTLEMRQAAVNCYLAHGKSLARTMRKMGYPGSQVLSAARHRLLRRYAAELVDLDLARRRDGQPIATRRVRMARRGRSPQGALGPRWTLPLAWMD